MRVGIGYDSHRFSDRRKLILGGVVIPHLQGLSGHSDADALELLKQAYLRVVETGLNFVSADITVILERPQLGPYVDAMREKLAGALTTGLSSVSVKSKTNEGMGWIGRGEGVAVIAVALLE